ncbi:MAG: WecB/TagA/CpsF family glycosyltransferase [Chthoniobacterales bacterium]
MHPPVRFCETDLTPTSYDELADYLLQFSGSAHNASSAFVLDFTNTHILVSRLIDSEFRKKTASVDLFIPDSTPLTWAVNWAAGETLMKDRVYGPEFTARFLNQCPSKPRHYFLGASRECLDDLLKKLVLQNPKLTIVGAHNGYFGESEQVRIIQEIRASKPNFLWLGLGTPKQQAFSDFAKSQLPGVAILNVGFAFDVNAGWKRDAPKWMQKLGLTWLFRMASEPKRLVARYVKFNSLFLLYAADWFLFHRFLPKVMRHSRTLFCGITVCIAGFAVWATWNLPTSLVGVGLFLFSVIGAWLSVMISMAVADDPEECFAPSKKLLNLFSLLAVFASASLCVLIPALQLWLPHSTISSALALALLVISWIPVAIISLITIGVLLTSKTELR